MKKRNNKLIILIVSLIIFVVFLGIFILNYSKDDYSFSILEKKWINDNSNNIIDISIYNDVPIFGKDGNGVAFDLLDNFTDKYKVNFNKISYNIDKEDKIKDAAFKILGNSVNLTDNDILLYEDNYVLISNEKNIIESIDDINNIEISLLSSDINEISIYLKDNKNISFKPKNNINEIIDSFKNKESKYALIPYNLYLDSIFKNNLNVIYHFNDISLKYVLNINNKTMLNIFRKYYLSYSEKNETESFKNNFLKEYFIYKNISDVDKMGYNANSYNVGYITYMPYTNIENNELVGILSNYLSGFEDLFDIDFKLIYYEDIKTLKNDLSSGKLDLVFANFNENNLNIDITKTKSLFKENYVVLAKEFLNITSIRSLKNREVITLKNSYFDDYLRNNNINYVGYDNTDELLRNTSGDKIVLIDKETYNYYKNTKFADYNELYIGTLPYQYSFIIRDVNKNTIMSDMFTTYVDMIDYNDIKYSYNTSKNKLISKSVIYFIVSSVLMVSIFMLIIVIKKRKGNDIIVTSTDKLKYIDAMTSLKNRTYLNSKIKEWDDNVIYPQSFVVVDLNNIKIINDSYGHEQGDIVIKKAASILIVNQEDNTDIVRTDGNEFLIYMVGYQEKDVIMFIRKIYKALKELPYGYGASIGYSMIMDDIKTVDDAINEATIDMRKKKEELNGQN